MAKFTAGNVEYLKARAFAVGNVEFLNSTQSKVGKYYREIESGTHGFIGRKLAGLWGNSGGPRGGLIGGALFEFERGGTGQKFVPFHRLGEFPSDDDAIARGSRMAQMYLSKMGVKKIPTGGTFKHGRSGKKYAERRYPYTKGVVEHEIQAHRFFERGAQNFDVVAREKEAIGEAFRDSGLTSPTRKSAAQALGRRPPTGRATALTTLKQARGRLGGQYLNVNVLLPTTQRIGAGNEFQRELVRLNRLLADGLAQAIAAELRSSLKRPKVSTQRLEQAILSEKNRFPV